MLFGFSILQFTQRNNVCKALPNIPYWVKELQNHSMP